MKKQYDFKPIWYTPWEQIEASKRYFEKNGKTIVERLGVAPLPTKHGTFTIIAYGDRTTGQEHYALVYGNYLKNSLGDKKDILIRIHSSCITGEIFDAINCDCPEQKAKALDDIAKEKRGIFIYLTQEGRGNGTCGKLKQLANMFHFSANGRIAYDMDTDTAFKKAGYEGERRDFAVAGAILKDLKVKSVRLITNNPRKIEGINKVGVEIIKREAIIISPINKIVANDLKAKKEKLGHYL